MGELRESKKRETRQRISDVATALFYARGFEAVTVDQIAAEANVSKVTVFNYFPRKEDLMFDREQELKQLLQQALRQRPTAQSQATAQLQAQVDALRGLVEQLRQQNHPFARIDSQTAGFLRVVAASPSLKARLREIGDEAADILAVELAGPEPDGRARLLAGMVVLTWRTAYAEAIRAFEGGASAKKANATFISLIDYGFTAIRGVAKR
ncbi:MAG: TetR family transcriptional regulator [Polyangiaceae bacterium]